MRLSRCHLADWAATRGWAAGTAPPGAALKPDRQPLHDIQVGADYAGHARPAHLDGHLVPDGSIALCTRAREAAAIGSLSKLANFSVTGPPSEASSTSLMSGHGTLGASS